MKAHQLLGKVGGSSATELKKALDKIKGKAL
jgi:hypothetical protein